MDVMENQHEERDQLKSMLTEQSMVVTFEKADGTSRIMKCTTNPSVVQVEIAKKIRRLGSPPDLPTSLLWKHFSMLAVLHLHLHVLWWRECRWEAQHSLVSNIINADRPRIEGWINPLW